ncbi:MAG TPA: chemotaxis protein CheD [Spirochaetia bacterium]|nr:MAG: hypothetical protein A2Y41_10320 [Spirochaetes bacterium GWB1_36_13]HCL57290.1 chemotaxis protein CheD [Spirochaetia bacterium]
MKDLIVGIGDFKVSDNPLIGLKTFALGSCIALMVYDFGKKISGMFHFALPDSSISPEKRISHPAYFADTGIPLFFSELQKKGFVQKTSWIKIAGGANILDPHYRFDIGRRNILAVKKILWKYNMGVIAEDVEGNISRTVRMDTMDGKIEISSGGKKWEI